MDKDKIRIRQGQVCVDSIQTGPRQCPDRVQTVSRQCPDSVQTESRQCPDIIKTGSRQCPDQKCESEVWLLRYGHFIFENQIGDGDGQINGWMDRQCLSWRGLGLWPCPLKTCIIFTLTQKVWGQSDRQHRYESILRQPNRFDPSAVKIVLGIKYDSYFFSFGLWGRTQARHTVNVVQYNTLQGCISKYK